MSQAHHTPLAYGGPLTSAAMEAPLGELDAAITDLERLQTVVIHRGGGGLDVEIPALLAETTGAIRILLPDTDGSYLLGAQVLIDRDNVFIEGAAHAYNPGSAGRTWIFVSQDIAGPAFLWSKGVDDGTSASVISGGGMRHVNLDGNSTTGDGIGIITGRGLRFRDIAVTRFAGVGIRTGSGTVAGTYDATVDCNFADLYVQTSGTGTGVLLDENTYACALENLYITVAGAGVGLDLGATDDIWVDRYAITNQNAGSTGIRLGSGDYGSEDDAGGSASSNIIGSGFVNGPGTHIRALGNGDDVSARRNLFLGIGTEDIGRPTISADKGAFPSFLDVEGRHNLRLDLGRAAACYDDFLMGAAGQLGWTTSGVTAIAGELGHPGIVRVSTGTVSGTTASLMANAVGSISPQEGFIAEFIFRLNTATNSIARIGLLSSTADPPTDGIFLEKVTADTEWFAVCRSGGVQTRSTALASIVNNGYVFLRIRRHNSTTVSFELEGTGLVNGNSSARITTNVPTAILTPGFVVKNASAADKIIDADAFSLLVIGLAR